MERKPWPIIILAWAHLLAPVANVLVACMLLKVDVLTYMEAFFREKPLWEFVAFFALPWTAAVAIYQVRKWSIPLFWASMVWIFWRNYLNYVEFPEIYDLKYLAFFVTLNVGVVSYFLVKEVRNIYYNPRLRWWEAKPRYRIDQGALMSGPWGSRKVRIKDLSEGGMFIETTKKLEMNDEVFLEFQWEGKHYHVTAKVVHRSYKYSIGVGVQFGSNIKSVKKDLMGLINLLEVTGVERRPKRSATLREFFEWVTKLVTTGKGLFPETFAAKAESGKAANLKSAREKYRERNKAA